MMLSIVTLLTLMTWSFMQTTRIVRQVDLTLSSMIPSVFERAVQTIDTSNAQRLTFDQTLLAQDIDRHLKGQLKDHLIRYTISLKYFYSATLTSCIESCDAVSFQFQGWVMHVWEMNRTFMLFVYDYETNND